MSTDTLDAPAGVIVLPQVRYVTLVVASAITGLTAKAMERRIEDGKWLEGREFVRRDGRVFVDLRGYERWVTGAG
jgi:hypothetical protein